MIRNAGDEKGASVPDIRPPRLNLAVEYVESPDTVSYAVEPTELERDEWHSVLGYDVRVSSPSIQRASITLNLPALGAWFLSSRRRLEPVEGEVVPPFPVGRLVVVKTAAGFRRYEFPWGGDFRLNFRRDHGVEVTVSLVDTGRCGLFLQKPAVACPNGLQLKLEIREERLRTLEECLWLEPFPGGSRAAVCLTDHADFDTTEKLQLLTDLAEKHGFRFTKSVFPQSQPMGNKNEPGLDVEAFERTIRRLHGMGTEIAYHGFGPRIPTPSMEECRRRAALMAEYGTTTWIDHGTASYLFSRKRTLENGEDLCAFLSGYGVKNYWSYCDIVDNPFGDVGCWQSRPLSGMLLDLPRAIAAVRTASPPKNLYLALHTMRNLAGEDSLGKLAKEPLRFGRWMETFAFSRRLRELRNGPFVLYDLSGRNVFSGDAGTWIFDTILLNHLALQLSPRNMGALVRDSGLLLAHCYLCAQSSYGTANVFEGEGRGLRIHPRFVEALESLGERQQRGEIVSLPFSKLRSALEGFSRARISRTEGGWTVSNGAGADALVVAGARPLLDRIRCPDGEKHFIEDVGYLHLRGSNRFVLNTMIAG